MKAFGEICFAGTMNPNIWPAGAKPLNPGTSFRHLKMILKCVKCRVGYTKLLCLILLAMVIETDACKMTVSIWQNSLQNGIACVTMYWWNNVHHLTNFKPTWDEWPCNGYSTNPWQEAIWCKLNISQQQQSQLASETTSITKQTNNPIHESKIN